MNTYYSHALTKRQLLQRGENLLLRILQRVGRYDEYDGYWEWDYKNEVARFYAHVPEKYL